MAKQPKKPLTSEEQLEYDLQQEVELGRLQRQYRIMERDRSSYSTGGKLAKHKRVIHILQKEQDNIKTDLFVATCSTKKKKDGEIISSLNQLLEEHDEFATHINLKESHLREIDYQIEKVKKEVIEARSKQITDYIHMARILAGRKTVEALENKLESANVRFCTILTQNRKLREEINHLLFERVNFNKLWERMINNLTRGKSFMMDLIEQATIAYDQRDECCTKLQALRLRAHGDLILHTQEMQELHRKLDNDGKIEQFLMIKGQRRVMRTLEEKETQKMEQKRDDMHVLLASYQKMITDIMVFTGVQDIDSLAQAFQQLEEENFGRFKFITVLQKEIEDLTSSLVQLHCEIDANRKINETRTNQQAVTLEKLTKDLEQATAVADVEETNLHYTENILTQLYVGIDKLFKICKCSNAPFLELLGDNTKINEFNAILYLEVLEQAVSDLLMNAYLKQKTGKRAKDDAGVINEEPPIHTIRPMGKIVPTNPCPLCVEQEQVQDVIDTLQFVETKDEVEGRLLQRLLLPDGAERLHNVSACHLPKSRQIIQRRYQ